MINVKTTIVILLVVSVPSRIQEFQVKFFNLNPLNAVQNIGGLIYEGEDEVAVFNTKCWDRRNS